MCLSNSGEKKIATHDITCYKVVMTRRNKYYTIYYGKYVKIGGSYRSSIKGYYSYCSCSCITKALHSYSNKRSAISDSAYKRGAAVIRCIIPKGAVYYIGKFGKDRAYASNKLKYVELVVFKN